MRYAEIAIARKRALIEAPSFALWYVKLPKVAPATGKSMV